MAITGPVVDGGIAGSSEASPGPTFSFSASAGQGVVVCGLVFSTSASLALTGISDNAGGNTWVISTSIAQSPPNQKFTAPVSGGFVIVFVAWCIALANPITSITITDNSGLSDFWRISASSWNGIVVADHGASNEFASTSGPASIVNLRNTGELVIGVANDDSAAFTGSPVGFTDFAGAGSKPNIGYMTPAGSGNFTAAWTLGAADVAATAVQAFSPAALPVPATAGGGLGFDAVTELILGPDW